ncbi:hypothetical protein [Bacillus infantis]|uniref:hypothetical protein n=1 Tax=Bacillus infantis TaxID=324767 RepID=UPI003CEE4C30
MDKTKKHWERMQEKKRRERERDAQMLDSVIKKIEKMSDTLGSILRGGGENG